MDLVVNTPAQRRHQAARRDRELGIRQNVSNAGVTLRLEVSPAEIQGLRARIECCR